MIQPWRPAPSLPTTAMKTYEVLAPTRTHWRKATCAEVDCPHHLHGWATTVQAGSADEALIRRAGRHFTAQPQPGGFLQFVFPAGQPCFKAHQHRVLLDRQEIFVVRGGDWRGNPRGIPTQRLEPAAWVDNFAAHQQRLANRLAAG